MNKSSLRDAVIIFMDKVSLRNTLTYAVGMGVLLLGVTGLNRALNSRTINKPAYQTESRATGLSGHIEYTKYFDGSQDVKVYPGLGHRIYGSEIHQDFNGDGIVDRIRFDGPEWKMHRLGNILERSHNYQTDRKTFDNADKQLRELMAKYPKKQ